MLVDIWCCLTAPLEFLFGSVNDLVEMACSIIPGLIYLKVYPRY